MTSFHNHTVYSDGHNTIEETVKAAIAKGFTAIGISDHAYTPLFDKTIKPEVFPKYLAEIRAVAAKYPEIKVYAGLENEYYCPQPTDELDYVVGSVHYLPCRGAHFCVDSTPAEFQLLANSLGGYNNLAKLYFESVADMAVTQKPDIIGHFDLITKLNKGLFDTHTNEYMGYVRNALDIIAETGCIIEVNTGGMAKGRTTQPYPEWHILAEVKRFGIPVTLCSDSHRTEHLDFAFAETSRRMDDMGLMLGNVIPLLGGNPIS